MSKVAVVTGANKGLGYEVVKGLATQFDGVIYLTARNVALGEEALKKVVGEVGAEAGGKVRFHQLDISSQDSVDAFKEHLTKEHGGIDVLVNNAAIAFLPHSTEPLGDQAEKTMAVNYYGNKRVCQALMPSLLRPHGRVVMVGSRAGKLAKLPQDSPVRAKITDPALTPETLDGIVEDFIKAAKEGNHVERGFPDSPHVAYDVSKMVQIALSKIQQRRLGQSAKRPDIAINACCPGFCATDLNDHMGSRSTAEGADTIVYLALLPENCEGPKGEFVADRVVITWEGDN